MKSKVAHPICEKATFVTMEIAIQRVNEINSENASKGAKRLRAYKCKKCNLFHLTSMSKYFYSITKDSKAREEHRRKKFIEIETFFYEKKFGLI